MNKLVKPSKYNAVLTIPSSKCYMQRAVALAVLADGETVLKNPDFSNDSSAALQIAEDLGCEVKRKESEVRITPSGEIKSQDVSVGEAGLGLRLFTPVCALFGRDITISGRGSLLKRPMTMMEKPMEELGVTILLSSGYVPLTLHGKLRGGHSEIDGSESSQFLTGLLTALPKAENDSVLTVRNLKSVPYVQMTLDIIEKFGGKIENLDFQVFRIKGGQHFTATEYQVEGDGRLVTVFESYSVQKKPTWICLKDLKAFVNGKEIECKWPLMGLKRQDKDGKTYYVVTQRKHIYAAVPVKNGDKVRIEWSARPAVPEDVK